jgi:hypothetical protein
MAPFWNINCLFFSGLMLLEITGELAQMDQARWVAVTKNISELVQTFKLSKIIVIQYLLVTLLPELISYLQKNKTEIV